MMKTPITKDSLKKYDNLPAIEAIYLAWNVPGSNAFYHYQIKREIQQSMPLLTRALDRLTAEDVELIL